MWEDYVTILNPTKSTKLQLGETAVTGHGTRSIPSVVNIRNVGGDFKVWKQLKQKYFIGCNEGDS